MANYFTDIVGGTREAFQRGYENVSKMRRDIGEQEAAKALARGDTRAAKQAYGRAGMAEQVDVLGQREASQAEAMRKRQEEMAETERKRKIEEQDRLRKTQAEDVTNLKAKLDFITPIAQGLRYKEGLSVQDRNAARDMLIPMVESMQLPNEFRDAFLYSDMTDQNLDAFLNAMGAGEPEPELPKMGSIPQGHMLTEDGLGIVKMPGYEPEMTPYQLAMFQRKQEQDAEQTGVSSEVSDEARKLRQEISSKPAVKDYQLKVQNVANMEKFAQSKTPAGDMSMIFLFMKMLDPTSVVREGEYATARNSGNVSDYVRNAYNKALRGTLLNENQRSDFLNQARLNLATAADAYQNIRNEYTSYANQIGVPVELVLGSTPPPPPAPRQGAFLLRPGAPGAPPPSPQARATGARANPPPYATAEEREYWSDMTPEEKAAVWAGE